MAWSRAPAGEQTAPCFRVALSYALNGELRYLSHRDELRMLTRALVRARWPLRYSRGFNPIPRLTLTLPRSVGTASECQLALVELREKYGLQCTRIGRVSRDSLAAVFPLVAAAGAGEILAPVITGCADFGTVTHALYEYDPEADTYNAVLLYQRGDWGRTNAAAEAWELYLWLCRVTGQEHSEDCAP